MADDITKLVLQLSVDFKSMERQMKKAGVVTRDATNAIQNDFVKTGNVIDTQTQRIDKSMRQAQQATQNLSFQFSDVAQGLASGTSPFTLMVQQVGQIGQALDGLGKGGLFRGLFAALRSVLSLQNVAVAAAIYGVSKLSSVVGDFFTSSEEAAKESEERWKRYSDTISGLKEAFGDAANGLDAFTQKTANAALFDAAVMRDELEAARTKLGTEAIQVSVELDPSRAVTQMRELQKALNEAALANDAKRVKELQEEIKNLTSASGQAEQGLRRISGKFAVLPKEIQDVMLAVDKGEASFTDLDEALTSFGKDSTPAIRKVITELRGMIAEAVKAERGIAALETKFDGLDTILQQFLSTTLPNLIKGMGEWASTTDRLLQLFGVDLPGALSALGSAAAAGFGEMKVEAQGAAQELMRHEGLRLKAYADKKERSGEFDAYRVGYGSDQYVDAMGQVQRVTKDTVITQSQALADLNRRIIIFQKKIVDTIGVGMWQSLSEGQKTALTDITYNFGHLPDSVARAIQSGDKGQVADAISRLSAPGQVNYKRRQRNAAMYASDSDWQPEKDVAADTREENAALSDQLRIRNEMNSGIDQTVAKQQSELKYADLLREARKESLETGRAISQETLDSMRKEADAYGRLKGQEAAAEQAKTYQGRLQGLRDENALLAQQVTQLGASSAAIDQNKVAQEAANEVLKITQALKAQGVVLTQAQSAALLQEATSVATAKAQIESYSTSQKQLTEAQKQFNAQVVQMAQSALSGFINDLRQGVSAGEAFRNMLNRVIDSLINMAIQSMFAENALGGIFKNFLGGGSGIIKGLGFPPIPTAHRGLHSGARDMRNVAPGVFANAPRLHSGLQPGEFPAILQAGEKVIPRSQVRRGGGAGGNVYLGDVKVDVSTGMVTASNSDARDLGRQIDTAVQAVLVRESRPGGLLKQAGR